MEQKKYAVVVGGWVLGDLRKAGDYVTATESEAEYALLNGSLRLAEEETGRKAVDEAVHEDPPEERVEVVASNSPEASADTSAEETAAAMRRRR